MPGMALSMPLASDVSQTTSGSSPHLSRHGQDHYKTTHGFQEGDGLILSAVSGAGAVAGAGAGAGAGTGEGAGADATVGRVKYTCTLYK